MPQLSVMAYEYSTDGKLSIYKSPPMANALKTRPEILEVYFGVTASNALMPARVER